MANPPQWLGMKYPDSDLVGLLYRYARPVRDTRMTALDVGCGSGRHLAVLRDLGYQAIGIDNDPVAVDNAEHNGLDAVLGDASAYNPPIPPDLVVGWGFTMIVPCAQDILTGWSPGLVILDWRSRNNTWAHYVDNEWLSDGRVRIVKEGHILNGLVYRLSTPDECEIPGYERIRFQTVTKQDGVECNEWYQTVHRRLNGTAN
ncbi:MAG: class I SAM-dependent methyltransferase [Phycisphaerales bacterium]|nr:class I SAM-dependent methyltransferase [Phycisphaerales bacterium]